MVTQEEMEHKIAVFDELISYLNLQRARNLAARKDIRIKIKALKKSLKRRTK
jgi:hypothetical protein